MKRAGAGSLEWMVEGSRGERTAGRKCVHHGDFMPLSAVPGWGSSPGFGVLCFPQLDTSGRDHGRKVG